MNVAAADDPWHLEENVCFYLYQAFDSTKRKYLWHVLQQYGIPEKILHLIQELYRGCKYQVTYKGNLMEAFRMCSGVRGCSVLSLTLFLIVMDDA
jgi:hypothetical protein